MEAKNILNFIENDISNLTINVNEKEEKRKEHISFQLNEPVSSFVGRKTELLEIHNILQKQNKLVICGLGGIGKSELIRAYCKEYQTVYQNNFIWINAETQNDMKKSFYELASELSVETFNMLRERNLKEIIKEEYLHFKNEKCLVIFDNAMCLKDVIAYFPPTTSSNMYVLLSSQNKEWGNVNKFELNVLTENESIELMSSLSLSDDEEDVKILVQMLQYLPLAIQQAAAYINDQKYISDTYKIRDYINIFEKEESILAITYDDKDAPFPDYSDQLYDKTIYKTLQITLAKIKDELALEILYICAFLAPDNIEKSLFAPLATNEDVTKLKEAIRILEKYFLIKVKLYCNYTYIPYNYSSYFNSKSPVLVKEIEQSRQGEIIFVHRVVQKMICYILKSQQQANYFIEEALVLATSDYIINGIHISSILKHSDQSVCLHFYENYCQNKEAFLCLLSCEIYFDTFKLLLNSDKDFDITNSILPIHVALGGSIDIMKYIIEKGANIYKKNVNGISAIQAASQNNQLHMLSYLIERGSSVNVVDLNGYTPLHVAVLNNYLDTVKYLVNKGGSINAAANDGCTLLIIAAQYGHLQITKYLLTIGCRIDIPDNDGFISLHFAAQDGHVEVLDYLLKNGAPIDYAAKNGFTSLHLASLNGHLEIVQCLVENGAAIDKTGCAGFTALLIAVQKNHLDIVKYLIANGSDINISSDLGLTSLHIASLNNYIKIVDYLVNNGCNINSADIDGDTPLHYAAEKNNLTVVDYLLENGALIDVANQAGNTGLHKAAREGHLDLVKHFVEKNASVNIFNDDGITSLHLASENGHLEIVEYLANKGSDIYCAAGNGFTPIHLACLRGHLEIVKFLVQKGVTVDIIIENGGYSPLLIAAFNGYLPIVEYLIEHGASIDMINDAGEIAIHLAAENGHLEIIQYLKSRGLNLNVVSKNGHIPLHHACKNGHLDVVQYLVDFGNPINYACNYGNTPLHIASLGNHQDIVKYLVNAGADINHICSTGLTATDLAFVNNFMEIAQYLLDCGGIITILKN